MYEADGALIINTGGGRGDLVTVRPHLRRLSTVNTHALK